MSSYANSGTPQLYKYLYLNDGWRNLVEYKHPWLSAIPKGDAATGNGGGTGPMGTGTGIIWAWNYSNPQSASMSHGAALAQQDSLTTGTQLMAQLSQAFAFVRFNAKELRASQNGLAAYMSSKRLNFDNAMKQLSQEVDLALHRSGNGIVGTITNVTNNVITLQSGVAPGQFQVNQKIVSCSTAPTDGTAPTAGTGAATITKVQVTYTNAQLGVNLTVDNPAGFDSTTNKYIAKVGNALGFSAANTEGNIIGFGNYVPTSSPSSTDNFLGCINRSQDEFRLAGVRIASGGRKYQEAVSEANGVCASVTQSVPDIILASPIDFEKASIELGANARYEEFKTGYAGFDSLSVGGPSGRQRWLMDPNQMPGQLNGMTLDTWKLFHMGAITHPVDEDGLLLRKDPGSDAFQLTLRSWPQQVCYEPGANWVITGF